MGTKAGKRKVIDDYRDDILDEKMRYPEIQVPLDFKAIMEMNEGLQPGAAPFAGHEFNDKVRIRFLQKQQKMSKDWHDSQMKEQELRFKFRLNSYVKACLGLMKEDL